MTIANLAPFLTPEAGKTMLRASVAAFAIVAGTCVCAFAQAPATAALDLQGIATVCAGVEGASTSTGRAGGTFSSQGGYDFGFAADGGIEVKRSGQLLYRIERFSYAEYTECISRLATVLSQPPIPSQGVCRIPQNGVERYTRQLQVERRSPEVGGGNSQPWWCGQMISTLRGEFPNSEFSVLNSRESSRSGCAPFNCPLYTYSCTVQVQTDPLFKEAASPLCPIRR